MTTNAIHFICGGDDFLVNAKGKILFDQATKDIQDEFAVEVIEGRAQNVSEVESVLNRFRDASQTLSLFGDKKVVWFRDVNFLADSKTSKAETTKKAVADWQEGLRALDTNAITVIITACPVDRRTKEFKWFSKNVDYHFIEDKKDDTALRSLIGARCEELKVTIHEGAWQTLVEKVGGHSRMMMYEVEKLATYLGCEGAEITPNLVMDMVPEYGEGDFFETAEAFYTFDLEKTLEAIKKHFFNSKEARPLLSSLQNRNRLLIQLRALMDAKKIKLGYRGLDKTSFEQASQLYADAWQGESEKSSLNVFTQNVWYLGKLAETAAKASLKQLIDFQLSFLWGYQEVLKHPQEQEAVMRAMAVRCLG